MDMAWKWVPQGDPLFEALFKNSVGISSTGKSEVMLRGGLSNYTPKERAESVGTMSRPPDRKYICRGDSQ